MSAVICIQCVGCSTDNRVDTEFLNKLENEIGLIEQYKPTDELIETARSIGNKLIIDKSTPIIESVDISDTVMMKIDEIIESENKYNEYLENNTVDHFEDESGKENEMDYSSLGIPTMTVEEIEEKAETAEEDFKFRLSSDNYYENTIILKYSNITSLKIVELVGNAKDGIKDMRIVDVY